MSVLTASNFKKVSALWEKLAPLITKLNIHLAQEMVKLKEDPGEGGEVAGPMATLGQWG